MSLSDEYIQDKINLIQTALTFLSKSEKFKINEIQEQSNKCYHCHSLEIIYSDTPDYSCRSFGDHECCFSIDGMMIWIAYCNKCGNEMPIYTQFQYDINDGLKLCRGDYFMDDSGNYGHCNK